nr:pilus assembly protein N-terminal domain-containing protein [Alphaproteobacteria bacterium]
MKNMKIKLGLLSFAILCGYASQAFSQTEEATEKPGAHEKKSLAKKARRQLTIESSTAEIVSIDPNVAEIFVANPDIADVSLQATGTAYIYGKRPGATTIYASSKKGENVLNLEVQVTHNMGALK